MVNCIALYPGQGAQYPKMAMDLYEASAAVRRLFAVASEASGKDLHRLLDQGTDEDLQRTENTQVASPWQTGRRQSDWRNGSLPCVPRWISLGEMSALAGASVLDDFTLFRIVSERGRLMARATESSSKKYGNWVWRR